MKIRRAHLEEDAGKNVHETGTCGSRVDLNRAGTPLLEIVTEPDMRSADEVVAYLKGLRDILMYLDVCDGNMDEGSFRCEPNLSLRPLGQKEFGTKVELKNINSFKFVQDQRRPMRPRKLGQRLIDLLPQLAPLQPLGRVRHHARHLPLHAAEFFIQLFDRLGPLALLLAHVI